MTNIKINVTKADIEWARRTEGFPIAPGIHRRLCNYMGEPEPTEPGARFRETREFRIESPEDDPESQAYVVVLGNDDSWHGFTIDDAGKRLVRQMYQEWWNPEYPTVCPEWNTGAGPMESCVVSIRMPYANWLEEQHA